jgi:hypothetical protein
MNASDQQTDTSRKPDEIVVFWTLRDSKCAECQQEIERGEFLRLERDQPYCLECADLDRLEFLPSGDAALTRRARKYSTLSAVVVRFSRSRGRYERQGLLVEAAALERAEQECSTDEERRRLAREKAAVYRDKADAQYVADFTNRLLAQFPGCPPDEAERIASHACAKYSGRVGRSAAAKEFDQEAITLAVRAHVRHVHSRYDALLTRGWERHEAREEVAADVGAVLRRWTDTPRNG